MNRLAKYILLILAAMLIAIGVCSCKSDSDKADGNAGENVNDNVVYSPYVETSLVLGEGVSEDSIRLIKNAYLKQTGKNIKLSSADSNQETHEIIIGETEREISKKAYRYLELMQRESEHVGYVIYSDGKSVAIAFDDVEYGVRAALTEAVETFVSDYMISASLKCKSGVLVRESFDSIEWQTKRDEKSLNILWNLKSEQILNMVGKNEDLAAKTIEELKALYEFYNKDQKTVIWLANLYDPESGGFYYSNSARNNQAYLPDLESTADAIGLVKAILANYDGTLTDYFGEEISEHFVAFVNNMQAEDNGYFYHPQWSKNAIDANTVRRSRDLMDALNILSDFGAIPRYDTPNGVKGEYSHGGVTASSLLVLPLREKSRISAVALIENEDDIYISAPLLSYDNFNNYLSSLNMEEYVLDSVKSISSQITQILFRDAQLEEEGANYRLSDRLAEWLSLKQNSTTGLWGTSKEINSESLNILYEIASIYNKLGKGLYFVSKIANKLITFIVTESDDSLNVNDIADAWVALSAVAENLNMFSSKNGVYESELEHIYSNFADLLESTRLKFVELVKDDGSFKTQKGTGDGMSYGMPIALAIADEGNVSATLTAIKTTWHAIFKTLNIGYVPIFMTVDRMMFSKTLLDMGVIIKNEVVEADPVDFEDEEVGERAKCINSNISGTTTATVLDNGGKYGKVLNIKSNGSSAEDVIAIKTISAVSGASCNVAELDMCVLPGTADGAVFRVSLYDYMYLLTVNVSGDTVKIYEDSYKYDTSYKHDLGIRAKIGEWFNIRIEYYVGTRETVRIKVFFNDECIAVTNNFYLKQVAANSPRTNLTYLRLETVKNKDVNILVDNLLAESNYKTYVPESNENGKLVRNADAPEGNKTVYNFEEASEGSVPSGFVQSGGVCGVISIDGNKKLSISSNVTELQLPLSERGTLTNSAIVEFDAIVPEDSEVGSYFTLSFNEYLLNDTNLVGFRFVVSEDAQGKYLTIAECLGSKEGTEYDNVRISLGESFKFRAHLFLDEQLALLMINNSIVGVNKNVKACFERHYMGEVTLASSEKTATLLVDNLVCERVVSDYKAVVTPSVDRETHRFDTLDGLVLNGVSISDGAVSFENAETNSYIKIAVNPRTGAKTFGAVFLDISKIAASRNDLIVSLTDKSGNKIVSFSLSATENSVDLYEYTEHGKYPRILYSVKASNFKLGIEYDITNGDFNLLVDGKYVVSTSVTYTPDSGEYSFEQLEISSRGSSAFIVDNVVAETSVDLFNTPTYKSPNKDNTDEIVTYEYSSFANIPTLYSTVYFATPEARLRVVERTVKGRVSRVLEYTSGTSEQDILLVQRRTKTLDGANAVAFETDLMIAAESKNLRLTLTLKPNDGTACSLYIWSKDGKIMINSKNLKNQDTYLDIDDGEWFNIRCEYTDTPYDYNYDGTNDVIVRVYINGEQVADGITANTPQSILSASTVNQARLDVAGGSYGKVYLDNTKYEQFNMEYLPPLPPDTDILTFEPGVINDSVKATLKRGSSLSVIDMTVSDEVDKVLKFVSASGANDKVDVFVTKTLNAANAVRFETDIMISPTSDTAELILEPLNANGRQPFRLVLTAEKGGAVRLSAKGVSETVIGNSGEWIHLKIEYMNPVLDYNGDGDRDILLKIHIDNARDPIVVYTPYTSTSHYNPAKLERFNISASSSSSAEFLLDDIKFWQIELTPDDGGVHPVEKENESLGGGGNTLDKDGWA